MVEIQLVRFEHHRESLGIGESSPRISWRFKGSEKNWKQSSYEIEVAGSSDKTESFKVESSDSVLVPWPAKPLKSRESAKVRVKATGSDGKTTSWSSWTVVETGLLDKKDWKAEVIAAPKTLNENSIGSLQPALFRKEFTLTKKVKSARLYSTAYGLYEAQINGTKVGEDVLAPGWTSYKYHLHYQTYDVTKLLKEGENVIGAEVGEGWFSGRLGFGGGWRCIYGEKLALLAQLEITFNDGEVLHVDSDKSWKTSVGPIISGEIYDGETYDASKDLPGWSTASFRDEAWTAVEPIEFPKAKLLSPEGPPIRVTQTVKAVKVIKTPTGKFVVDFGQNLVGWLKVKATGPAGHTIAFTHTEVLEHGEAATRPLRNCLQKDHLILSGKSITWEPKFTFHGFRYVQVDNWPSKSGEPALEDVEAIVVHTDMEQTGWFECSEPMVNKLHENIRWGMRGNFVGIPTDCPQRDERLGWTGDIQIFSPTANFLYDTAGMLSGWLKDLAVEQINDLKGVVAVVVPNILPESFNQPQAAWADAAIITPWDLYTAFGDRNILSNQHESMKTWLEKGIPRQSNGLWDPSGHQLGDWLDPDAPPNDPGAGKTDPHLVANAYLVHITSLMANVSAVLGHAEDAKHYSAETSRLKKAFQNEYMTPNGRLAPDSMTALALAIAYDLFATKEQFDTAAKRLDTVVRKSRFRISTGFVGTPLILPALTKVGKSQLAYRMLAEKRCPSWLYPITMGATTMWERWDSMLPDGSINPGEMTSFNHYALGSVASWLHSTVGGISPLSPGWRKILFAPLPGGSITSAKTKYVSYYGEVSCEWILNGEKFEMRIKVPPNCEAEVELPGKGERGREKVGSGEWTFDGSWKAEEWPPQEIKHPYVMNADEEDFVR